VNVLPETFRAFVVEGAGEQLVRGVRRFAAADLPDGEVTVRVSWSTVNFKDGLAAQPDGKVARISPLIPGIDLAGEVVASDDPGILPGDRVIASGYDLGVSRHGGYAEYQRVPSGWVVPLPAGLTEREAMAIGTAGFTAAMSLAALEARGLEPGGGPVLVTGASGGLGRIALGILAARGHEAWAMTRKPETHDRLRAIGAAGFVDPGEVSDPVRPLASARWAGAIDAVGGPTMAWILATLRPGAAVAACGNAGGPAFSTTVLPFILRGVALLGMNSVPVPIGERRALWARLASDYRPRGMAGTDDTTEVTLDTLEPALDAIVAGRASGRWVVRIET
jgi:acrylyl-CoA reductase (NADPH)